MPRTLALLPTLVLTTLVALPALAQPQVETLDPQGPAIAQRPALDPYQPPHRPPPEGDEGDDGASVASYTVWGSGFRLGALRFRFDDAVVSGVNGSPLQVPDRANLGGLSFGGGYRPTSWLRLPEVRLRFGGGGASGSWAPMGAGLEARSTRFFVGAIDLVAGFEHALGRVTPFLRGYFTAGFATVRAEIRHADLGALGTERVRRGWLGAGVEAGFIVRVGDVAGIHVAYRGGLWGPEDHSVSVGVALVGD